MRTLRFDLAATLSVSMLVLAALRCSPSDTSDRGETGGGSEGDGKGDGGSSHSSQAGQASGSTDSAGTRGGDTTGNGGTNSNAAGNGNTASGGSSKGGSHGTAGESGTEGSGRGGSTVGGTPDAVGGAAHKTGDAGNEVGGATNTEGGAAHAAGRTMSQKDGGGEQTCHTPEEETFSFFLLSRRALQRESGNEQGFGGNLGGITGADGICQHVAEFVSPCQKSKVWHAFLSTTKVDAIDRIGQGPWYDRVGRLLASNLTDLAMERPGNADPAIKNDLPNEDGVPNHAPQGTEEVDNHEILTGSGTDGRLYNQTGDGGKPGGSKSCGNGEEWSAQKATCWDWTTSEEKGCPRVGHSWPRKSSGMSWMSAWNEGGCAPGGTLEEGVDGGGGLDGTRRVGSAGGYGGFYCFAVTPAK